MNLRPMDYVRAALANAMVEDMDITDLWRAAEEAKTPGDFDERVNAMVHAKDVIKKAMEAS